MNLKYSVAAYKKMEGDGYYDELFYMESNDLYEAEFYCLCLASERFTIRLIDHLDEDGAGWIKIKWYQ